MIFMTALAIGATTGLLRSAFCVALVGVLIGAMFLAAALVSVGPLHWLGLLQAVAGYNAGLISLVIVFAAGHSLARVTGLRRG